MNEIVRMATQLRAFKILANCKYDSMKLSVWGASGGGGWLGLCWWGVVGVGGCFFNLTWLILYFTQMISMTMKTL